MPKDAGSAPSAASANGESSHSNTADVPKGEKVTGRSWHAILVVSVIGVVLVLINYMNSEMAPPPSPARSSSPSPPAPSSAPSPAELESRNLRKPQDPHPAAQPPAAQQSAAHQEQQIVVPPPIPDAPAGWRAPPYKTGGFVDLRCINGSSANVIFKEGAYHAMCIHNGAEMISAAISQLGAWEPDLCTKIQFYEKIGRGMSTGSSKFWFVDVGANIGFLSLCGYQVLPTVSIEAAPWNFDMLDQTRQHWQSGWNDRPWYTVHQAVSTSPGHTVKLLGSVQNFGGTNLVDPNNHPLHLSHGWGEGADIRYGHVITETLDTIIKTYIPREDCIAVMKMDIEGYEYFATQSFADGLRTRPPCNIFMEYHTILLKAASSKKRDDPSALKLAGILQAAGYVGDQVVPQDPAIDVELNIHWQLKHPKAGSQCDCAALTVPMPR